jgi:hypothetical protein
MKLLSTATLAATLLSYVAADGNISKVQLHQRALKILSGRKFQTFSRELEEVSMECLINQGAVELTGVNELANDLINEETVIDDVINEETGRDGCVITSKDGFTTIECDYDDSDFTIDSDTCVSAGGSVVESNMDMDCDEFSWNLLNLPYCLHTTCDAESYIEMMSGMLDMRDEDIGCVFDIELSGATSIGSTTSIISIAFVSLLAMLW